MRPCKRCKKRVKIPKKVKPGNPYIACPHCGYLIPLKVRRKSGMVRGIHGNIADRQMPRI